MTTSVSELHETAIRVIVVAHVRLYRDGLAAALGARSRIVVVGTSGSYSDTLRLVEETSPDVAIVDTGVAQANDLMLELRAQAPATSVIAFAVQEDIGTIVDCAEAGAAGYVSLDASMDDLVAAVERIAAGELVCPPRVTAALFKRLSERSVLPDSPGSPEHLLTRREREVLLLLRQGLTNKEIASSLNISQATVKNHVHHLLEKLNVGTRGQAAARADLTARRRPLDRWA